MVDVGMGAEADEEEELTEDETENDDGSSGSESDEDDEDGGMRYADLWDSMSDMEIVTDMEDMEVKNNG